MNALSPKEVKVIQLALTTFIEDNTAVMQDTSYPFTPEARMIAKDLLKTAKSSLEKIVKASGHAVQLDPYQEGDEHEFLTKQS